MNEPISSLAPMLAQFGQDLTPSATGSPVAGAKSESPKAGQNRAEMEDASKKFEAMMVQMLLKQMQQSMGSKMFADGHLAMFQDFFNRDLAENLQEGGGLGLADQMMRTLDAVPGTMKSGGSSHVFLRTTPIDARNKQISSLRQQDAIHGNAHEDLMPPVDGLLTSRYGLRKDPFDGRLRQHGGMDIAAPTGTPIRAVAQGVVVFAGHSGGYGNLVVVRHADGTETRYGHCATVDVDYGDPVSTSTQIGTVGSTGRATGPHVHFEVRKNGHSIDPETWLNNSASKIPQPTQK